MKRRDFIQNVGMGVMLPGLFKNIPITAFSNVGAVGNIGEDHVLVVVELNGGNDGLNTVIPLEKFVDYQRMRPNIAIPEKGVLSLSGFDKVGLHPSMRGMQSLFNDGKLSIVQGVGYANPNFSHFRSTDIWNTASDADTYLPTGWIGRFLTKAHPNYPNNYPNQQFPDPLAMQIGNFITPAFQGIVNLMGIAVNSNLDFYGLNEMFPNGAPNSKAGNQLRFIREVSVQANAYAKVVQKAASMNPKQLTYPSQNPLANQLRVVSKLIAGGLKTKIYFVTLDGFDTHSDQTDKGNPSGGNHASLLGKVSDAIKIFMDDLKQLGVSKRVTGLTFSEFGRRIKSNDSNGTDHGTSAPMFVFGDLVNPSVIGKTPDLITKDDNLELQYDFRSVYGSVLKDWFCVSKADLDDTLLKTLTTLPVMLPQACGGPLATEPVLNTALFNNYPNPFREATTLSFNSKGGLARIQVFDNAGHTVVTPVEGEYAAGQHEVLLNTQAFQTGMYYARFQNRDVQQVIKLVKL